MKTNNIFKILAFSAASSIALFSCEDEVMVKTEDTTAADAIIAEIDEATEVVYTLDQENASLRIENAKLDNLLDSLDNVMEDLQYSSSTPIEVHYTVAVLSAGNAEHSDPSLSRTKGVAGATVVVEQDGEFHEPSSSSEGLYLFKGLSQGNIYVTVSAPEHTTVEYQAYIFVQSGEDVRSAKEYNASTQVTIYPNAGALAGTLYGKAYANTTVLNDTVGRTYGSDDAIFGAKANTWIAPTGQAGDDSDLFLTSLGTSALYGGDDEVINYEFAMAGHKIYAMPELNFGSPMPNPSINGYTTMVTYKGIITSAEIAADGSYTLPVIATNNTDELIDDITIMSETYVTDFVRLTSGVNYYGQTKEAGDTTRVTFKYYNNNNFSESVYTGNGTTQQSVDPNEMLSVKRLTIKEKWSFMPYFLEDGDNNQGSMDLDKLPMAGEKLQRHVFFFPHVKQ